MMHHWQTARTVCCTRILPAVWPALLMVGIFCLGLMMDVTGLSVIADEGDHNCTGALQCKDWFGAIFVDGILVVSLLAYLVSLCLLLLRVIQAARHEGCGSLVDARLPYWIVKHHKQGDDTQWDDACYCRCFAVRWLLVIVLLPALLFLVWAFYATGCVTCVLLGRGLHLLNPSVVTASECPAQWANASAICLLRNGPSGCAGWGLFLLSILALIAFMILMLTRPQYIGWCCNATKPEKKTRLMEKTELMSLLSETKGDYMLV